MGWGVLEDPRTPFPTGTVRLEEDSTGTVENPLEVSDLKTKGKTVLQPQPGDDPNDPLNWTTTWKIVHLFVIAFGSSVTNAMTTMATPGLAPLVENFNSTEADISTFVITAPTFWTSIGAFLVVSGSDIWGRRPFYVFSIALLALSNFLAYIAHTFPILITARTLGGIVSAPLFTLVTATIADIFFVHQRGSAISVWNLALNAGAQVGQIVAGFVTDSLGVSAVFGLTAIVYAVLLPVSYYLVLESGYFKRELYSRNAKKQIDDWDEDTDSKSAAVTVVELPPRKTYSEQLALFNGRLTDKNFWLGVAKPLGLLSHPIVFYSAFLNSLFLVLLAGVSTLAAILLAAPPYNLSPSQIGLTNIPLFVVTALAGPLVGWLSDVSVRAMARTNGSSRGVAEPEFRLALLALTMPISVVGLIGLGSSVQAGLPLIWVLVWLSVIALGSTAGVQIAVAYVIDAMPQHSAQAFSSVNATAALVVFAGIAPLIGVLDASGPQVVFGSLAAACVAILVFTIPLWVFGKRIRAWYGRSTWVQNYLLS